MLESLISALSIFSQLIAPRTKTLNDVMAANYAGECLHDNVTAYDVCMYLSTGYQANVRYTDGVVVTTEAYDDIEHGTAKILARYVDGKYNNETTTLDCFNSTQPVMNFNTSVCSNITEKALIDWVFSGIGDENFVKIPY